MAVAGSPGPQVGQKQSRSNNNEISDFKLERGELAQDSPTRSMMPSTAIVSPSWSHHFASQTWHEQNTTSVPSGSVISISITELCPQDVQTSPPTDAFFTCPPFGSRSPATTCSITLRALCV